MKVKEINQLPALTAVAKDFAHIDYMDIFEAPKPDNVTFEQISKNIFRIPAWAKPLFAIRNAVARLLMLDKKQCKKQNGLLFPVIAQTENEIIFEQDARHLKFRASVLQDSNYFYMITLVKFHNLTGRLYFVPVKPFHKLLIKSLMKKSCQN